MRLGPKNVGHIWDFLTTLTINQGWGGQNVWVNFVRANRANRDPGPNHWL